MRSLLVTLLLVGWSDAQGQFGGHRREFNAFPAQQNQFNEDFRRQQPLRPASHDQSINFPTRSRPQHFGFQQQPQQSGFQQQPQQFGFQQQQAFSFNRQPTPQQFGGNQQRPAQQQFSFQQQPQQFGFQQQPSAFNPQPAQQFVPQQQPRATTTTAKPKKAEVDPSTLNPPTDEKPSPTNDQGRRFVAQPDLAKCQSRIIHGRHGNHGYYFSWLDPAHASKEFDWLDARNFCRQRCMDSVSIETREEDRFVQQSFNEGYQRGQVEHVWTSGRLCDFDGCDRPDLQPLRVNGWFWPSTGGVIVLKNNTKQYAGWSDVGGFPGQGQPDNRNGEENCIALLKPTIYNEPDNLVHWHDVKCIFKKKMLCEDNDNLLGFIRQQNPGANIP